MKFNLKKKSELPSFQITSMMDVIFLLLCFFVTASAFSQWEYELDVVLPTSETSIEPERLPGEIIVNIDEEGIITINQVEYTPEMLLDTCNKLAKLYKDENHSVVIPVVIRADQKTDYANVLNVIDICRQADLYHISFATGKNEGENIDDNSDGF